MHGYIRLHPCICCDHLGLVSPWHKVGLTTDRHASGFHDDTMTIHWLHKILLLQAIFCLLTQFLHYTNVVYSILPATYALFHDYWSDDNHSGLTRTKVCFMVAEKCFQNFFKENAILYQLKSRQKHLEVFVRKEYKIKDTSLPTWIVRKIYHGFIAFV